MRRILFTSCRMPTAIDEIRKLGRAGHEIVAADTFRGAAGAHSKYVKKTELVASPRYEPRAFVEDVARIIQEDRIDVVVPCFEEVLYLARARAVLPLRAECLFPEFEYLKRLHDKHVFVEVARHLGVRVPRCVEVTSRAELDAATADIHEYFAKPVYSRGGVFAYTNRGPLAGARDPSTCNPTPRYRWVVEEYLDGPDVCSFSVVRNGRVRAHVTYVHPREIEHAGGTVFESIEDPETLAITQRFAEWSNYDGQIAFDFRRTARGLYAIECNPRPTAGVHLMSSDMFVDALLSPHFGDPHVVRAGVRAKYAFALVRNMFLHVDEAPDDFRYLFSSAPDPILDADDPWPAAWQVLSSGLVGKYRRQRPGHAKGSTDLMAAYFDDISWNGELTMADA